MDEQPEKSLEAPQEAALIAVLSDMIERLCVEERPAVVVQSPQQQPAKAA